MDVRGAFISGDWKVIVNEWCAGWSPDTTNVAATDAGVCVDNGECSSCTGDCSSSQNGGLVPRDYLFNLKEDPEERVNLIGTYPDIASTMIERLRELGVNARPSVYRPEDASAESTWRRHSNYVVPWL
ncbi:unnamed protein product [Choristocarpus tenellus]